MREQNYSHDHYYGYDGDKKEAAPCCLIFSLILFALVVIFSYGHQVR